MESKVMKMKKLLSSVVAGGFLLIGTSAMAAPDDDRDCGEFASHEEVMQFWYDNGYSAGNDPHDLDRDNDGLPCEVSSSQYNDFVASQEESSDDETTDSEEATTEADETVTQDGEELPDTATNSASMIGLGAILTAMGAYVIFRKKSEKV
jgi:LPXTG-motif cell wall-anchored protein